MKFFKNLLVALSVTMMLWIGVSIVDINMHNTSSNDGEPHDWNLIVIGLDIAR